MMHNFLDQKLEILNGHYHSFEAQAAPFKDHQACLKGCAFCCRKAGSIDITTLEGWQIKKRIESFSKDRKKTLIRRLRQDIQKREKKSLNPCPFLMKNNACMIYEVRPFSCRRIYSTHVCDKNHPPRVSKQMMVMANTTIKVLQRLDITGYSGHISFILHMIDTPAFMRTYAEGSHEPLEIIAFGKSHNIVINKMMLD